MKYRTITSREATQIFQSRSQFFIGGFDYGNEHVSAPIKVT